MKFRDILPGLPISILFFLGLLFTLKDYGMHEDSPFHFLRGQSYLQKFLTGEDKFKTPSRPSPVFFVPGQRISLYKLNASEELLAPIRPIGIYQKGEPTIQAEFRTMLSQLSRRESFYKHNAWTSPTWDIPDRQGHPAVSDTLMAAFNRIFYEGLGVLGDIEAYYLYIAVVSSLGVFFVFLFVQKAFGLRAAIFSSLALALFPYFFSEAHFNIKDPVQMSFFTMAIVSFYFWLTNKLSSKWFEIFILATFLALGTKWNIMFLPFIVLPWLFIIRKKKEIAAYLTWKNILIWGLSSLIFPLILLIIAWPFLWSAPWEKLFNTLLFYRGLAFMDIRTELPSSYPLAFGLDARAFIRIVSMTPPLLLILFLFGSLAIIFRKVKGKYKEEWLVMFWLAVPLARVIWQQSELLGSIRNFVEYLPAFAIISGLGADMIIQNLEFRIKNLGEIKTVIFKAIFYILYTTILLIPIIKLHPNENLYFNSLVGGIAGAKKLDAYDWYSSYGNLYRQGVNWFNKNATKNARLAYLDGTMLGISPLWLRDDIQFGSYFSGFKHQGEYIISIIYTEWPNNFEYPYLERFLKPIYEIKIDNEPVLKIWQNDPKYLNPGFETDHKLEKNLSIRRFILEERIIWEINLDEKEKIAKIFLKVPKRGCIGKDGVWSVISQNQRKFLKPQRVVIDNETTEFNFAAEEADKIRFWDIEGTSCLYQAELKEIYVF